MSKMIIMRPWPIVAIYSAAGTFASNAGTGAANLMSPEPKEVYHDGGGGGIKQLHIDLGQPREIDLFFLGFRRQFGVVKPSSLLAVDSISGGPSHSAELAIPIDTQYGAPSAVADPRHYHLLTKSPAPVTARYLQIWLGTPTIAAHTLGILAMGKSFTTTYNREKGGGRTIIDTAAKEGRQDGGFGIGHGTRKGGFRWTFGDLSDAEIEALYDLALNVGEGDPIVVVEDPDITPGLNERIHYGLFNSFEHYERGDPSKHRWALSMTEWV